MSKADLLLNKLDASRVATRLANASEEPHLIIGDDRVVNVPDELKRLAVQYDHDIETVTFDCPRYWDEHDMSKMGVYINYLCADQTPGVYQADNVRVDEADSTVMHFDWTISRNVSLVAGQIAFLVCVRNADAEGFEKNHWNSEICTSCYISKGLEYDGEVIDNIMSPDLIEQWRKKVNEITDDLATRRDNGEFNGATFTPQVDARGYISWSNDKNLANPPAVNIRGPKGISPKITVTDIQGGHRIQIDAENYSGYFDVMDTYINSSDAVTELLNRFITVSSVKPTVGPGIWFDSSNHKAANHAEMHVINADGTSTPIYPDSVEVGYRASSNDNGQTYTVTVPGIRKLEDGTSLIVIPDTTNPAGAINLRVNNLGEHPLMTRAAWNTIGENLDANIPMNFLKRDIPIRITFSTIGNCWIAEIPRIRNKDFEGVLTISNGGTGEDNAKDAIRNFLNLAPVILSTKQCDNRLPSNPENNQLFFKFTENYIDEDEGVLIYQNNKWVRVSAVANSIILRRSQYGDTFPLHADPGQVFFNIRDTSVGSEGITNHFPTGIYIYNGTIWNAFVPEYATIANSLILNEQQYGDAFPGSPKKGQVFFRPTNSSFEPKGIFIYDGTNWVSVRS